MAKTARRGLSLNEHAIPSFEPILATTARSESLGDGEESGDRHPKPNTHGFALNAYILDFYTHGQVQPLSVANAIRRGDVWFVLQEFDLTLKTVRGVLERLIEKKREGVEGSDTGETVEGEGGSEDLDSGFFGVGDPMEKDEGEDEDGDDEAWKRAAQVGGGAGRAKPNWAAKSDWRVLEVVRQATEEFDEKFREMWA